MSSYHEAKAFEALSTLPREIGILAEIEITSAATAHALLALVGKIGELIDEQRLANIIAAVGSGALDSPADLARVRAFITTLFGTGDGDDRTIFR
ncbi:hypothetical protein IU500_07135 [Nocardia terpenica]|uniref:Uncharacterized protein n=1 Tax=Nocardia terpenica TaxID=455432 RepID=A0A164K272_9NOCA|nr:hypothetical protein [Nocardia terpenica]KZM70952.1 hypothetical protein AWN90_41240 [Nocardia terpenica]MBF6060551.1 hypothetical protein [Nocardia terpenica]MBF6103811.1 hypothetical protein [Nocardia terpenica]MBF6111815.1 hypothetical protein [Nocardia terpenica]MBF6118032.1 hypothetical protein [Nocardia terpenica]